MASGTLSQVLRRLRSLVGQQPVDELADDQLLERFVARQDPQAFAALVERYGPLVMGVCRRTLGDADDADDAFQATFLVFARRAGSIRNQGLVGSWLCGTAYRISLKAKAAAARRRAQELQASQMPKHDSKLETAWKELRPILDEELSHLPEKYRVPLVLCYLEGKSNEAAAKELGWPAGSMSYRLTKGRELLKERLRKRGVAVTTALLGPALAAFVTSAVPAALAEPTVKAGLLFGAGQTVANVISTSAETLADSVLHTIHLVKMLLVGLGVLSVVVVAGTGFYLMRGGREPQMADAGIVTPLDAEPRVRVQLSESQRIGISLTKLKDPRNPEERKRLTRDARGLTNNTRFRIDGSEYVFGTDVIENPWVREGARTLREAPIPGRPPERAWQSVLEHDRSRIRIAQQVEIVVGEQTRLYDTVLVRYVIENRDGKPHVVGLRALIDTLIGNNDGVPFLIPPGDDPAYLMDSWAEFDRERVPPFIRAIEDLNDANGVVAEMGLRLKGVEPIDRLVICRWPDNTRWGGTGKPLDWKYEPISLNPAQPDSCVVMYWSDKPMQPGEKRELAFTYGLGRISSGQGGPREQLRLLTAGASSIGRTFTATAYVKGIPPGQKAKIELPKGLELAEGQKAEQVVPAPGKQGYSQVSWKVKASQTGDHEIGIIVAGWHTVREIVHIRDKSLFD